MLDVRLFNMGENVTKALQYCNIILVVRILYTCILLLRTHINDHKASMFSKYIQFVLFIAVEPVNHQLITFK